MLTESQMKRPFKGSSLLNTEAEIPANGQLQAASQNKPLEVPPLEQWRTRNQYILQGTILELLNNFVLEFWFCE